MYEKFPITIIFKFFSPITINSNYTVWLITSANEILLLMTVDTIVLTTVRNEFLVKVRIAPYEH